MSIQDHAPVAVIAEPVIRHGGSADLPRRSFCDRTLDRPLLARHGAGFSPIQLSRDHHESGANLFYWANADRFFAR
jgi:hypothetical protein